MRTTLTRESFIPKGSVKVSDKISDAVAYLSQFAAPSGNPRYLAVVFVGKQNKPISQYYYRSEELRARAVAEAFTSRQLSLAFKSEQRANRKQIKLELGHILRTCWGYDQTNVEFYQVTKLIGSTMVEVREIAQVSHETGHMTGSCTPVLDKFCGEPIRCRLNESGVKVERHYASLWNGTPARWSSYA